MQALDIIDGRYRVVRERGRGGMGVVWEAVDTVLDRPVAIKQVVLPDSASEEEAAQARARLLAEAQAAARLTHPHAVTVHTVVTDGPWIVMELVDAPSLLALVRRHGPLPPRRAAAIGAQIADCLRAAHAAGLVHRDVKPSNVLVADGDAVQLTDFGLAAPPGEQQVTLWGNVLGSPPYLSPEQAAGGQAGPASDWWGLGGCLFYAVEGEPPFRGDNMLATLNAVIRQPPAAMRRAGPLAPLITALLDKDPDRRPDPAAIADQLAAVAAAPAAPAPPLPPPTVLAPPTPPAPRPRRGRRRAVLAGVAALAVAGAVAGVVVATGGHGNDARAGGGHGRTAPGRQPAAGGTRTGGAHADTAAGLPSSSPRPDAIRWQGTVTLPGTGGIFLDEVPPRQDDILGDVQVGGSEGQLVPGGGGAIAPWPGQSPPTRQQCSDQVSTNGLPIITVRPHDMVCARTGSGRIALLTMDTVTDDNNPETADVVVWELP